MIRMMLVGFLIATAMGCQSSGAGGGSSEAKAAIKRDAVVTWPQLPATEFAPVALEMKGDAYGVAGSLPVPGVVRPATVTLPATAGAPFEVRDRDVAVRVKLLGQQAVPAVLKGDSLLFPGGFQGADVTLRALPIGVEDFISLDGKRPPAVDYEVELEGVAGLRLASESLEFLTSDGNPRLRMSPPVVLSRKGRVAVAVSLQGCAADTSPRAPWGRPVTAPGAVRCTVHLAWDLAADGYPAILDPGWTTTANLSTRRSWHPTVTLGDGRVLVTGGFSNGATAGTFMPVSTTEVYDPVAGTWAFTGGALGPPVYNAPALWIPAPISKAYVFGGGRAFAPLPASAEVKAYDPVTGLWVLAGNMLQGLEQHTATFMPSNAKVLIAGGTNTSAVRVATGELFTPSLTLPNTGTFVNFPGFGGRCCHVATLLPSGNVLVSHGIDNGLGYNLTALIYNPVTPSVTSAGAVILAREFAAASTLVDGRALITGGAVDVGAGALSARLTTELFSEGVGFSAGPSMAIARYHHQQIRLGDNRILVAGGESPQNVSTNRTETWVPGAAAWVNGGNLAFARRETGIALTGEGYVIVSGGGQGNGGAGTFVAITSTESFELRPNGAACTGPGPCLSRNCVDGVCCDTACAGDCDACNIAASVGTCIARPATTLCRGIAVGSLCDVTENCTGTTAVCPADLFAPINTSCRASVDVCDRPETCPGNSSACPADLLVAAGQACRTSMGSCDVVESCTGSAAACPTDAFLPNTTACRTSMGMCDVAENCPGNAAACPADAFNNGLQCRMANGLCDVAEVCSGMMANCPADALAPVTTICRSPAGTCDLPENCSGTTTTCGADVLAPQGSVCDTTYICSGVYAGCPTTCSLDSDCVTGATCINGMCVIQVTPGNPCTVNAQCTTNFCVDGVCCNSACTEACATCNLSGSVGTCAAVAAGNPGDPSCSPYLCDGTSRICPGSCSNNTQCVTGFACIAGSCQPVRTNGVACTADTQCLSGFCTDGVCCNARCEGSCQACNVAGSAGTCTLAGRGEVGEPVCAPFVCDGMSPSCPTTCADDAACGPPAFCENKVCTSRTRGHVGFGCPGCSGVDGASLLGLLGAVMLLRRRVRRGGR